jgi:hypothetical protein
MKTSRSHPDNLCFPLPPARIDRTLTEAPLLPDVAATYLTEIQRWRDAVVAAVAGGDPAIAGIEHLTPRARNRLTVLLDTKWDARTRGWAAASDYALTPFPATRPPSQVVDPMKAVLEVLHWRAAVVNYLTDVWYVVGKPEIEMGECGAIGEFMRPASLAGRCVYCLTEFNFDRLDPEDHGCLMVSHVGAR